MRGLAVIVFCFVAAAVVAAVPEEEDQSGRGLLTEMADLWEGVSKTIDDLQLRAGQKIDRLKPTLVKAETRMDEAGQQIQAAFESLAQAFGQSLNIDRVGTNHYAAAAPKGEDEEDEEEEEEEYESGDYGSFFNPLHGIVGALGNPFTGLFGSGKRWYEGDNVCVEKRIFNERPEGEMPPPAASSMGGMLPFFSFGSTIKQCSEQQEVYQCTTVTMDPTGSGADVTETVIRECCYGFVRVGNACAAVQMEGLRETLENKVETSEFLAFVKTAGLDDELLDANITVFAPTDDAMDDFSRDLEQANSIVFDGEEDSSAVAYNIDDGRSKKKLSNIVKSHFADGFLRLRDLTKSKTIKTLGGGQLRVQTHNFFQGLTQTTVNCASVVSKDNHATNGVVHVVDRVIVPATRTVGEMVRQDVRLRAMAGALEQLGLMDELMDPEKEFTLFAPTDEAFSRMDGELRDMIGRGNACSKQVVERHIYRLGAVCGAAIAGGVKSSIPGMRSDEHGDLFLDDAMVVAKDVVATNGVIHILEDVAVPDGAKFLGRALEDGERGILKELMEIAGGNGHVVPQHLSNETLFLPSAAALAKMDLEALKGDIGKLREVLAYSRSKKVARWEVVSELVESGIKGKNIRLQHHTELGFSHPFFPLVSREMLRMAQCVEITHAEDVCGGTIETVDRFLTPPAKSVMEILRMSDDHKKFMQLIMFADVERRIEKLAEDPAKPITIFAPDDDAFDYLSAESMDEIFGDKKVARRTVMRHVARAMHCCATFRRRGPFDGPAKMLTADPNSDLTVKMSARGRLFVQHAKITECDMTAEDGVVHSIDEVLLPDNLEKEAPGFSFNIDFGK